MGAKKKAAGAEPSLALGIDMVKIVVGPEKALFLLHKDRLCQMSEYFRGLFQGNFKDAKEDTTTLAEEDVTGFKLFQHVVYNNSFPQDPAQIQAVTGNSEITESIVKFYVLADQLILDNRFKLQAIRAFTLSVLGHFGVAGDYGRTLASSEMNTALVLLPDNDPFLKIIIDITAYQFLKRSDVARVVSESPDPYDLKLAAQKERKELTKWMEECVTEVAASRVALLFTAMAEFTRGFNNSGSEARQMDKAVKKGVEGVERYAVGSLAPAALAMAEDDEDGDEQKAKRVKLDDGE